MDEGKTWFLEVKSIPVEDAVKSVEITTKDLDYEIKLVIKQRQGLRGLTAFLKEVLVWVKCYQIVPHAKKKSLVKGRVNQRSKLHYLFQETSTATPAFSNHHPEQSAAINTEARLSTSKKTPLVEGSNDG